MALPAPGFRFRGLFVHIALTVALLATGCAQQSGTALIDDLRDADLSEKSPQRVRQSANPDGKDQPKRAFETYPGDDGFGEQLTRTTTASISPPTLRRSPAQAAVFRAPVQQGGDGYQLNFDNASLAEVVKVILGDTLKLPYFYDPRVQGQITLSTGKPVTRDELLSVLESALKMNNGVLAPNGGGYRIAPAGEAVGGDVTSVSLNREESLAPGFGVSVLPLHNVSADAMLRLLENFISKGGSMKAETTGNLLLIRGTANERRSLMDVATSFDVDWLKGQSAGIFPLTHSTPDELINELTQTMQSEQGDLVGKMVRFQPIHRLNAVLVLARQSSYLKTAADWIRRLDRSSSAGQSLYVYRVENGKAQDLATLLNDTLGSGGGRRTSRSEVAPGRGVQSLAAKAAQPSNPLSTGSLQGGQQPNPGLQGGQIQPTMATQPQRPSQPTPAAPSTPGVASPSAPAGGPPEVRIIADEVNNLLLINSSPSEYQRILTVLRTVDRAPLQVMINATIAEVTLNDTLRYGVQVFLKGKKFHGGGVNQQEIPLAPSFPGMNFILGSLTDPKLVLDALADVTEVKVVSSPSVVVLDNQPALLKVGDEVPISTQQTTAIENPNAPLISSIRFRDTGVILKVIPRVNSSGLVTMDIEQEISAVVPQAGGPTLTPTISQRRIASTISVYSGQMVALGGLISEQQNRDKSGLPIINKVPILGDILGTNARGTKRTELIVFIRPQVIRDPRDARAVAEELRSRLHSMSFPPPPARRDGGWNTRSTSVR